MNFLKVQSSIFGKKIFRKRFCFNIQTPAVALLAFFVLSISIFSPSVAFGNGEPTILTPTPFTGKSSILSVESSTGAFTQHIPITVPPGRNGIQPNLTLDYNSQHIEDGIVGYGWGISIPYIYRLNKTGTQDFYTTNVTFASTMDGELVQTATTSTIYRARTDTGEYLTYVYADNTWTVYDKKGTRYIFGATNGGRQYDTDVGSSNTYKWALQEIRDTNDNYATFAYSRDSNELYPYQIKYTGNGSIDGSFVVDFATTTRPDVRESYKAGFDVTTNYRISEIRVSVSGTLVNKYALSYGTGSNGYRSLLMGIQQTGYDESSSGTTLPAMTFTYASSSQMFIEQSDSTNGMVAAGPGYIVTDMNGNGVNDIATFYRGNDYPNPLSGWWYIDQENSTGYYQNQAVSDYWAQNNPYYVNPVENGLRFLDVNGDGKADLVKGFKDDLAGTYTQSIQLSNYPSGGYSWTATTSYSGLVPAFGYKSSGGSISTSGLFGEVNGDGYVDFVMALTGSTGTYTYAGNGSAWATSTTFAPVFEMSASNGFSTRLIDINGDGLDDWVYSNDTQTFVRLNTGSGWESSNNGNWTIATSTYYKNGSDYYDRGIRFVDINGDGLPDFIRSYTTNSSCPSTEQATLKTVLLNTGNGWATSTEYTLPGYITSCNSYVAKLQYDEYANWIGNGQMNQDVITGIITPQGGYKNITYSPTTQLGNNGDLPFSLLVATAVGEYDGFGSAATTSYAYSGGKLYLTDKLDRRFAGFAVSTTTAPDSITATYYSQGDSVDTVDGEQGDGFTYIGKPFRKDTLDLSGNLKQRTYYRWDTDTVASSTLIALGEEMNFDYLSSGAHKDSAIEYLYATTTTRDLVKKIEYGEVSGTTDGTFSDVGSDKRITEISYATATSTATTSSFVEGQGISLNLNLSNLFAVAKRVPSLVVRGGSSFVQNAFDIEPQPFAAMIVSTTQTSTPVAHTSKTNIRASLMGESGYERATTKGGQIAAKIKPGKRYERETYDIELVSVESIDGGVQAFARAWRKDGTQIGFGKDGSVDMERFRVFNPPILVPDTQGDIAQTFTVEDPVTLRQIEKTRVMREDPEEALLQVIEQAISVMKNIHGPENILSEKLGKTIDTYYPDADTESTSFDGELGNFDIPCNSYKSWGTMRDSSSASEAYDDNTTFNLFTHEECDPPGVGDYRQFRRSMALFDTTAISDNDVISSATLSFYGSSKVCTFSPNSTQRLLHVVASTPASNTEISTDDWDQFGNTSFGTFDLGSSCSNWDTSGYNNISLNSSGLSAISKTGVTKFGMRSGYDLDNSPAHATGINQLWTIAAYAADNSGTTQDPKLVVEHTASDSDTAAYTISVPSQETITNQSSSKVKETKYFYDNLALGSVDKGNLTKRDTWISGSIYASDQFVYNSYGLIASSTNPRGNITTNTYDSKNLYVATSTNALFQQTQAYYDYTLGKPKQTIDQNGLVFETTYDGFDRPLEEKQPDTANPGTLVTRKSYAYTDTVGSRKVIETNYLDASTNFTLYTYLDGLDRIIQTRKEAEDSGQYAVRDYTYNSTGLLEKESLPYFSSGSSRTSATVTANLYINYAYDALKRPLTIANAVGTTTTVYEGWSATTTDANGNDKGLIYDAFKRLKEVFEYDGGTPYATQYEYDTLGNLTKVTDALSNVRNFTYDGRSKRITAQDLHDPSDGTYGAWSYVYDSVGNLASTTDPKSQQVDYVYDALNRPVSEDYTGDAGTEIEYGYDDCTYGVGKMCVATSTGTITTFTYNALGLHATEIKTTSGTDYTTSFLYDRQGNPTDIVYPDNSEVQYTYNTAGLPETVTQRQTGGTFWPVVSDFDYNPLEKVTYKEFGNGATTTYTYNAAELYRLTNIYTSVEATSTSNGGGALGFTWNPWEAFVQANQQPLAFFRLQFPSFFKIALAEGTELVAEDIAPQEEPAHIDPVEGSEESTVSTTTQEATTYTAISSEGTDEPVMPPLKEDVASYTPETLDESSTPSLEVAAESTTADMAPSTEASTTSAGQETAMTGNIWTRLADKSAFERASIKGSEIAKLKSIPKTDREDYTIEIVSAEEIPGGVQAFVRAWDKNGDQIGFGKDGSVDTERFRFFNPPVLVSDPKGDIVQEWQDLNPETGELQNNTRRLRQDTKEALLQAVEQAMSVMKNIHGSENIEKGKQGHTVSTFYPDADPESMSFDGAVSSTDGGPRTWDDAHDDTGGFSAGDNNTQVISPAHGVSVGILRYGSWSDSEFSIVRAFLLFDTSTIGSIDTISSATLSVYGTAVGDAVGGALAVVLSNPASNTGLANSDIDDIGTTTQNTTNINFSSFATTTYNNFSLSTTGISNISKTGVTKFGMREANYDIPDVNPGSGNGQTYVKFYASDNTGTTEDPKLVVEHTAPDTSPAAPTSLLVEGDANPTNVTDPTPDFSAIFNDPTGSDTVGWYQIQVSTTTTFATSTWDSTKTAYGGSPTSVGDRVDDISYTGIPLASSTVYFWRIKFWDNGENQGPWSDVAVFSVAGGSPTISTGIQDISYTYDSVGNITKITDTSNTEARKTNEYIYDTLYRLTHAYTTVASSTPYGKVLTYNELGNLISQTDVGIYSYTGTTTGSYANPHAPTIMGTTTLSYDNNGNLTNYASSTYGWDYKNRLISSAASSSPTTYFGYDNGMNRVWKYNSSVGTTTYASKYFVVASSTTGTATTTKNIYTPDGELVAYIETVGATSTRQYVHNDHLGSVSVTTNSDGDTTSVRDYYPFGSDRVNEAYGIGESRYSYIGREKDSTGETYLNARYYDGGRGQFLSQDPVFWEVGQSKDGKVILANPQAMNSYSYSENNPIIKKDPTGRLGFFALPALPAIAELIGLGFTGDAIIKTAESFYSNVVLPRIYPGAFTSEQKSQGPFRVITDATLGFGSRAFPSDAQLPIDTLLYGAGFLQSPQYSGVSNYRNPIQTYTSNYPGFTQQLSGMLNYTLNSSSIQVRSQGIQSYNNAVGATTNESKLWLTPNGTVVTWSGGVVTSAPKQSSESK